jgi:hypothetical protein
MLAPTASYYLHYIYNNNKMPHLSNLVLPAEDRRNRRTWWIRWWRSMTYARAGLDRVGTVFESKHGPAPSAGLVW